MLAGKPVVRFAAIIQGKSRMR